MDNKDFAQLKSAFPNIQSNVSLRDYSAFKIGGEAKYFLVIRTKDELIEAVELARENNLPIFILGGGSKLLISDKDFNGLVIKIQSSGFKVNDFKIFAESGLSTAKLTEIALENNLTGLEWLKGIPGTVGGAIRGNAGAFDGSMKNVISFVEVFDKKEEKLKIFKNKNCRFAYRTSVFKENPDLIILSCTLQLKKGNKTQIENKMKEYLNYRTRTQPLNYPSAGSVFKNFDLNKIENKLFEKFPEFKKFRKTKIIPAGFLIEKAGLKGKIIGGAKVSEKHANFIVNFKNATAKDVKELIDLIKNKVKDKFKIELEEEVQYFNF
ncbi:MAG: UDP-N-acetylmuramate dehydrogenase [Candidatus Nealsonbacteria bacterium]